MEPLASAEMFFWKEFFGKGDLSITNLVTRNGPSHHREFFHFSSEQYFTGIAAILQFKTPAETKSVRICYDTPRRWLYHPPHKSSSLCVKATFYGIYAISSKVNHNEKPLAKVGKPVMLLWNTSVASSKPFRSKGA